MFGMPKVAFVCVLACQAGVQGVSSPAPVELAIDATGTPRQAHRQLARDAAVLAEVDADADAPVQGIFTPKRAHPTKKSPLVSEHDARRPRAWLGVGCLVALALLAVVGHQGRGASTKKHGVQKAKVPHGASVGGPPRPVLRCAGDTGGSCPVRTGEAVLTEDVAGELVQFLPQSLQQRSAWRLAYASDAHGASLSSLQERMATEGPSLFLVEDQGGTVFGGLTPPLRTEEVQGFGAGQGFVFSLRKHKVSELVSSRTTHFESIASTDKEKSVWKAAAQLARRLHASKEAHSGETVQAKAGKFGSLTATAGRMVTGCRGRARDGEALSDDVNVHSPSPDQGAKTKVSMPGLDVFPSAESEQLFMYSSPQCVALGGGSECALYVDKGMVEGASQPCASFKSRGLSSTPTFAIKHVECWVFDIRNEADDADEDSQAIDATAPPRGVQQSEVTETVSHSGIANDLQIEEDASFSAKGTHVTCPNGHALHFRKLGMVERRNSGCVLGTCASCGAEIPRSEKCYSCKECSFSVCAQCYDQ